MIGKINPKMTTDLESPFLPPSSQTLGNPDFESMLKERLEDSKVLELITIQFLSRVIDQFMSRTTDEENTAFVVPSPSFRPSLPASPKTQPILQNLGFLPPDNSPGPQPSIESQDQKTDGVHGQGYDDIIEQASSRYGVDPALIKAVMIAESGGNPYALSPAGAQGLMQLMPRTAADLGVVHPFDPVENIMAGTRYLRQLLDRYWGNVRLVLAAYNWGMGNVERRPEAMPRETKNYIVRVENLYRTHLAASR
jgi:soluble lytic murein transglycosylase-like protein